MLLLLLLCDSARETDNHDVDRSRNRMMILVYTSRVIAGTRTVVQPGSSLLFSCSVVGFAAALFRVLELLLGLVFVEFASERG